MSGRLRFAAHHGQCGLWQSQLQQQPVNEVRHLARRATAQLGFVFLDHHQVGMEGRCDLHEFGDIGVLPVAGLAEDQGEPASLAAQVTRDIQKTTQAIRQALMKDGTLSITAKNIKVITANGHVTLRGPVKTAQEKTKIDQLAKSAAGGAHIDDQLDVKGSN